MLAIPTFTPTSSPELDELFLNFREKIFSPFALAQHHRDLIYKKRRHPILLNDPGVTVTLSNDEEIRLMPLEPRERPNKRKSLNRLIELLKESTDAEGWTNLPAFLEGMEMAKEELPEAWIERLTRSANMAGKSGVIKLCAEMVKKTGATLANPAMTRELMLGYHMQAAQGQFSGEPLQKALKSAEQVSFMMEDKLHCAGTLKAGEQDMRKDPVVLGVLLELAACNVMDMNRGAEDTDGKVARLVTKTLACTKDKNWELPTKEHEISRLLTGWVPLANGMRVALLIPDIEAGANAEELRSAKEKLAKVAWEAKSKVQEWSTKDTAPRPLAMIAEIEAVNMAEAGT